MEVPAEPGAEPLLVCYDDKAPENGGLGQNPHKLNCKKATSTLILCLSILITWIEFMVCQFINRHGRWGGPQPPHCAPLIGTVVRLQCVVCCAVFQQETVSATAACMHRDPTTPLSKCLQRNAPHWFFWPSRLLMNCCGFFLFVHLTIFLVHVSSRQSFHSASVASAILPTQKSQARQIPIIVSLQVDVAFFLRWISFVS